MPWILRGLHLRRARPHPIREKWAREVLALRIIDGVKGGERDIGRLREDALIHLKLATTRQSGLYLLLVH